MKLLGLEAWIECDGKHLDEYNIEVEGNQIACWVASEVEKNFCTAITSSAETDCFIRCNMDGLEVQTFMMTSSKESKISRVSKVYSDRADELRPLRFSTVTTTEPQDTTNYYPDSDDIGLIEIQLWRVKNVKTSKEIWSPNGRSELLSLRSVPEARKVLSSHCVGLGDPIAQADKIYKCTYDIVDDPKRDPPFISFRFKYRSREILQALGIIPRPPVPQPAQSSSASTSSLGKRRHESIPGDNTNESRKRALQPSSGSPALVRSTIHSRDQASEELKPIVHVKDESGGESDDMDALETQFELMHRMMKSMKKQIDRMNAKRGEKSSARAMKREAATINLGSWSGETIDLTDD